MGLVLRLPRLGVIGQSHTLCDYLGHPGSGCDHFRTDVSCLPDLTAYLDDLLRTRERLAAAAADDWTRSAAAPPEQEIRKIRELIGRIKGDIAGVTEITRTLQVIARGRSRILHYGPL